VRQMLTEEQFETLKLISTLKLSSKSRVALMRPKYSQAILDLIQVGFLEWQDGNVKLTEKGLKCLS